MKLFHIKMILFNIGMFFILGYPAYKISEPRERNVVAWLVILMGFTCTLVTGIIPLYKEIKNKND